MFVRFPAALLLLMTCTSTVSAQQYINLLENQSLQHWMTPGGDEPPAGWQLGSDGVLHMAGKGGNLLTREEFGDFELWFEFKITPKGNSGIKYRVQKYGGSWLGLEYQVLDDNAYPKLTREHLTASLYDLVTPIPEVTRLNPVGEYNIAKIRVANQRAQHWINGQLMIDEPLTGSSWKEHVANSKFKKHAEFGENVLGHLMLTDHGDEAWYRNIYIRRLGSQSSDCSLCNRQVSLQP